MDGRANEALVAFLAKRAGVAKGAVRIVSGHSAREKLVEIEGIDAERLRAALFPGD